MAARTHGWHALQYASVGPRAHRWAQLTLPSLGQPKRHVSLINFAVTSLSNPDIRCRVTTGEANLVRSCGPPRLFAEIDEQLLGQLHAAAFGVAIDHRHPRTLLGHFWIELIVPDAVQRTGHVQPLPVQAQLQHLRAAGGISI